MATDRTTEMTADETAAFLRGQQTGVLALARDEEPYGIPVSYGFDGDDSQFYMRLVSTPESEKRRFLGSTPTARLVVYDGDDEDVYRSVVAVGSLERVDPSELSTEDIHQYGEAKRPLFEVWPQGKGDLDIDLYRLVPERLSGRRIDVDRTTE
jgi:nitroimidazol reductase NimA-like FMN-containing flavoprotein (pyridoxamine 5'-phosphate oxidase superfamily)